MFDAGSRLLYHIAPSETNMPKPLPITDEIQQIKARLKELQNQQLEELRVRRRELADELAHVEKQIADITGTPVQPAAAAAGQGPRKRAPKLPKLVKDSDEYKEIARNVQTILAKEPTGLNGKQVADALGYQQMNERNRIKELLNDPRFFRKTGLGVSTKFFLR
jgi:tetrahydromethanopterin S-methyltransferase subunit G